MAAADKVERVLEAAAAQFLRYGFARTTMADIAAAAGMARPSLYLLYPGKAEIFAAAVRYLSDNQYVDLRAKLRDIASWSDKLQHICEQVLVGVYELQRDNPDAGDMDDVTFPVVRDIYGVLQDLVADVIAEAGARSLPASPQELARVLVYAVRGLGETAQDAADMRVMTRLQVDLLCRAIGAAK